MQAHEQKAKGETFRQLHHGPQILMLPNAWDVGSAVMLEQAGFPAIATTSAGIAFAAGSPDHERLSRDQMLEAVGRITSRLAVPVTADLETGYGPKPDDVAETIRQAIAIGVVGANIEDRNPNEPGELFDLKEACERIRAAREAADSSGMPFVLNARTDPFLRHAQAATHANVTEAVQRGNAYREAGADCIFVPGVADPETIGRLVADIDAPMNVLGALSGTAAPPLHQLAHLGVRRVTLGGSLSLAVFALIRRVTQEIQEQGTFSYATQALSNGELNRLFAAQ